VNQTAAQQIAPSAPGQKYSAVAINPRSGISFEMGLWYPFSWRKAAWRFGDSRSGFFVSPLVKVGYQTQFSPAEHSSGTLGNDILGPPIWQDRYYWYYGAGGRAGFMRFFPFTSDSVKKAAPVVTVYTDVVIGRWSNFSLPELCRSSAVFSAPCQGGDTPAQIPWRTEVRTYGGIPYTSFPVYLGFVYNRGGGAPKDVRFFVGYRYDLGSISRRLRAEAAKR
jgi:hypothetical protein